MIETRVWITVILLSFAASSAHCAVLTPQWTYDAGALGYDSCGNWRVAAASNSAILLREPGGRMLIAVDSAAGKQLWSTDNPENWIRFPFADWWRLVGSDDALVATYNPAKENVDIRSVRTGNTIDPLSQAGQDQLRKAGVEKDSLLAAATPGGVLIADILAGSVRNVAMPKDYRIDGETQVVFLDERQLCVRIDTDNGHMGHSGWPKYLYCCTLAGDKLWQFPKVFRPQGPNHDVFTNSVDVALYVKPAQVVVVLAEDCSYGLRSRDGRILWQKKTFALKSPAVFRQGILGLDNSAADQEFSLLVHIDAKTGTREVLGSVPKSNALFVFGDVVFITEGQRVCMLGRISAR